jgi:hypothetical protein
MTTTLAEALRTCARGLHCAEAGVELLIGHKSFLHRRDFRDRFIRLGIGVTHDAQLAEIDWPAAVSALDTGDLPCSSGERRILRLAASLAEGIPVDLRDTITGLDNHNITLVITAVLHTAGQRQAHQHHDHV